jgi:ATP-dependent Clp protease ATP-binding subunit ClpA
LLGLLRLGEGPAFEALETAGVSLEAARTAVVEAEPVARLRPPQTGVITQEAKNVFTHAQEVSTQLGDDYVGTGHLLLGLCLEDCTGNLILRYLVHDMVLLREEVTELLADRTRREPNSISTARIAAPAVARKQRATRRIVGTALRRLANRSRRVLGVSPLEPGTHSAYVWGFGSRHRAHCDCGWDGQRRTSDTDAVKDSIEHMRSNESKRLEGLEE